MNKETLPKAVARGLLAGVVGTAAMTAWQKVVERVRADPDAAGPPPSDPESRWEQAPGPAKVARKIGKTLLGRDPSPDRIPLLTNVMHWSYGITWGGVYGLFACRAQRLNGVSKGPAFGAVVWVMSYVQLVPLGIYEPPWRYPAKELALDLSYHVVYGTGTAIGLTPLDLGR